MELQSAYNSGLQGFQRASNGITEATVNINREAINQQRALNAQQSNAAAQQPEPVQPEPKTPALEQSLVQLTTESLYAEANVRSIKTADEMLGTLIDVSA
ncbi:excinuclease ATPase subunit [Rheinheimera texasensis]|uniref:excinuclease ATPase subunit n=1 Tax=Rheinheimera texasensis TaxID=306205 RepID=UPI0032B1D542